MFTNNQTATINYKQILENAYTELLSHRSNLYYITMEGEIKSIGCKDADSIGTRLFGLHSSKKSAKDTLNYIKNKLINESFEY
ncbi:MAG: hypothetical protein ABIA91_01450 [Patescibacteria group bacterium]